MRSIVSHFRLTTLFVIAGVSLGISSYFDLSSTVLMPSAYADCAGGWAGGCAGWDWWGWGWGFDGWGYDPFAGVEIFGDPVFIEFTYISSWSSQWSDCNNLNSSMDQCTQVQTHNPIYATGYYTLTPVVKDGVEIRKEQNGWPLPDVAKPSDQTVTINITIQKSSTSSSCVNKVADSIDPCSMEIAITTPTIENKPVTGLTSVAFTTIEDISWIDANRIDGDTNPSTNNALILPAASTIWLAGGPGNYKIVIPNIRSVSPFSVINGALKLNYSLNWISDSMLLTNINYKFTKPFYGTLRASDNNKLTWDAAPRVGTSYDYLLNITGTSSVSSIPTVTKLPPSAISTNNTTNQVVEGVEIVDSSLNTKDIHFKGRINTSTSDSSESLTAPTVRVSPLEISYSLSSKNVKYSLTSSTDPVTTPFIELWWSSFIGIRVVWQIQWTSKAAITSGRQEALYFKVVQSSVRNDIRKNIATTTRARTNGSLVNGVKYITWDYTLTTSDITNAEIETIVIDGGNLLIKDNIPKKAKTFWLVVLHDKSRPVLDSGNILISKNITSINGLLYADGALFSTDENGVIYKNDVTSRNTALNRQLIINGSIITTNSIWWATNLSWGKSLGIEGTTDFEQAMIYDLNYFRKGAVWCDKNSDGDCADAGEYPEPMVVIYDPRLISSPPKGFTVK